MNEEVVERTYTVVGMWWGSGERWLETYTAGSPQMAESVAHAEAASRCLRLAVCGVFEGELTNVDTFLWADPSVTTQEEMNQTLLEIFPRDTSGSARR